jgi:biotin synthase
MNAILQAVTQQPAASIADKWSVAEVEALYDLPLMDLLYRAQQVHREHFDANEIQRSRLVVVPRTAVIARSRRATRLSWSVSN